MSKQVLLVCAGGMSSSVVAKKVEEYLQGQNKDYEVTARGVREGIKLIEKKEYDLYLISPQTRMYMKDLEAKGKECGRKVVAIPPQAYVPVPAGTKKLAELIEASYPQSAD